MIPLSTSDGGRDKDVGMRARAPPPVLDRLGGLIGAKEDSDCDTDKSAERRAWRASGDVGGIEPG